MRNPSTVTTSSSPPRETVTTTTTPSCSKVGIKRGPWTPEEDELLSNYIKKDGEGRWRTLPKRAGLLRCGKSCRLRWMNYLRPSVKRGQIAPDEEDLILRLHRLLGNRWSLIAGRIPGRTDNEIKNYWNTHLSKKLISQGIDPRTHKPLVLNQNFDNNNHNYSDHDPKPSSSKSKNVVRVQTVKSNPNPNPKPNLNPSNLEQGDISKSNHGYYENTNLVDDQEYGTGTGGIIINNNGVDQDDVNYCTDDVFSSFLNTLINEDVYIGGQHQQVAQQPQAGASDVALISSTQAFGFSGTGWENAIMSNSSMPSSSAFNNQIND